MNINKISGLNKILRPKKTSPAKSTGNVQKKDSVSISNEARNKAELQKFSDMVRKSSDVRQDRIDAVRKRLQENPDYYNSDEVLRGLTDKLADAFSSEVQKS